jgi:hypothetical protein
MRTDRHWLHQKLVARARANGLKAVARGARRPEKTGSRLIRLPV